MLGNVKVQAARMLKNVEIQNLLKPDIGRLCGLVKTR